MTNVALRGWLPLAGALALVSSLPACGGPQTSITQTWKAPAAEAKGPIRRVLVFAARMDETQRRVFEDTFVRRLALHEVAARPSYELFPGPLPDRDAARATASKGGFEGLLVVTSKGTKEVQSYVPGTYVGDFWGAYYGPWTGMGAYYSPGYVVSTQIVSLEMTLWDARVPGGRLVWSAMTRTTDLSEEPGDMSESVAEKVLPQIAESRLIPAKRD